MYRPEHGLKRVRFTALDGWRGIIACIIALCHLNVYGHLYGASVLRNAYILVDVFFVLSGFVISHSYLDRVTDGPQVANFIGKRFARLWPMHAVMLAAFIACEALKMFMLHGSAMATEMAPFEGKNSLAAIIPNLMLIHSLGIYDDYTWNIPSWALSVEFYTYIVFGMSVFFASRTRIRESAIAGMMVGISIVSLFVILRYSSRSIDTDVEYGIFRCIMDFGVGYLAYRVWKDLNAQETGIGRSFYISSAFEVLAVSCFAMLIHFAGHTRFDILSPIVAAIAILIFAFGKGLISRVLSTGFLQRLGRYSYCIYIMHVLIVLNVINRPIYMIEKVFGIQVTQVMTDIDNDISIQSGKLIVLFNQYQADILTLIYLSILVVLAGIAYNCIEIPCSRYLDRLIDRATAVIGANVGVGQNGVTRKLASRVV